MFCSKCGNKIKEGERFCGRCGNPVNNLNEASNHNIEEKKVNNNIEKYKKVVLISLIVLVISFILVGITSSIQTTPGGSIIWSLAKIVFFVSLLIYGIGIIAVTVVAKKNKQKLKGWISAVQTITLIIVITAIVMWICAYFSNRSYENAVKNAREELTSNNSTSTSSLDFNNPSNIKNGEIAIRDYAASMNLTLKNIDVKYLETDGKGKYAFKGTVAVSFDSMPSYSQTENWYIVIDMNTSNYEGAYSLESAKFAMRWGK